MHCATIASNVGGVPYLIENGVTGLLFEPRDVDALSAHITTLAQNAALRRQLAESLYERASEQFSIDVTIAHQIEIYETILRRARAGKQKRAGVMICGAYGKGNAGGQQARSHPKQGTDFVGKQKSPQARMTRTIPVR